MRVSVAVTPAMGIKDILRNISSLATLKASDYTGFKFNSSYSSGGIGDKQGSCTVIYISLSNLLFYLWRKVNNITVSCSLENDFLGDYYVCYPLFTLNRIIETEVYKN